MAELVVIVPSRGRPEAAEELARVFEETCVADTWLCFAIDVDDEAYMRYGDVMDRHDDVTLRWQDSGTMVSALNVAAGSCGNRYFAVGFMGDDHRPRTKGWDQRYLDALRELGTGIVYGDDLLQGEKLPTQCAMTADIVRTLGHMAPPTLRHMYVDNYWLDLGRAAGCIRYLPEVVVEHMHPFAGKSEMDEGYARVNASEVYAADQQAYAAYHAGQFAADAAKVTALRGAA